MTQVRLVDENGEQVGVVDTPAALQRAMDVGLDLVEVSPNADPPVCKIIDHGKLKYQEQKKRNEARKKQKTIDVKEIKLRPNIDDGDKVKVTLRFRGREMAHQDLGAQVLERVRTELDEIAKVEQMPKMEGRQMVMVISPR